MAGVNQKIDKDDFNDIQSKIENVLGTGSGQSGYGQPVLSEPVTVSDTVTINEYAALRFDIINAYRHLFNGAPSGVDDQTLGTSIRYSLSDAPINYWLTITNSIVTNKGSAAVSGQRRTVNHGTESETWPGALGTNWSDALYATVTVEFTNSEFARYFFNAGGSIDFTSTRTGGSSTNQNASWTSLLSTAGTRSFGGNFPGTGVNPNDGSNYFRLNNTNQTWSTVTASSPYALNSWRITAATNDSPSVTDNSAGSSRKLIFRLEWIDDHFPLGGDSETGTPVQPGTFGPDVVDGSIAYTVITTEPTGVLEPSGAGNFTVESPTVTISPIRQSP
jgi:hypothetical protein